MKTKFITFCSLMLALVHINVLGAATLGVSNAEACGQGCQREARDRGVSVRVIGGQLVSTSNGVDWVTPPVPTPSRLRCVAGGRGVFVAVGDEGALVTSRDGIRWTLGNSSTDERLRCVVYAQDLYVAVGYGGTIITSKDGVTWKRRNSRVPDRLQGIAYGNGAFMAVGWNGCIVISRDGKRWTPQPRLEGRLQSVVFRNGVFVTNNPQHGNWISRDGTTWWVQPTDNTTNARSPDPCLFQDNRPQGAIELILVAGHIAEAAQVVAGALQQISALFRFAHDTGQLMFARSGPDGPARAVKVQATARC